METKYQCLNTKCKKTFQHTATRTYYDFNDLPYEQAIASSFIHPADKVPISKLTVNVCPYCGASNYTDYIEPQPEIEGVLPVTLEQVNETLKQNPGYVVKELYAKTATLVKYKEEKLVAEA